MKERIARGVYRGAYCCLLDDPDFLALRSQSRHVLLTMRLSKEAGPACIWLYRTQVIAEQSGLTWRAVEAALQELEASPSPEAPWILRQGRLLWIRNGLLFDPTIRLTDKNHAKAVKRAVEALPRCELVAKFCDYYEIDLGAAARRPVDNGGQPAPQDAAEGPRRVPEDLLKKGPAKVLGDLAHPIPNPKPIPRPSSSRAVECGQLGSGRTGGPQAAGAIAARVLDRIGPGPREKYGGQLSLDPSHSSAAPRAGPVAAPGGPP